MLKLSSQEHNKSGWKGGWKKAISSPGRMCGLAKPLSLCSFPSARKFCWYLNQGEKLLGSLSETTWSPLTFWAQATQSLDGKGPSKKYHHGQETRSLHWCGCSSLSGTGNPCIATLTCDSNLFLQLKKISLVVFWDPWRQTHANVASFQSDSFIANLA